MDTVQKTSQYESDITKLLDKAGIPNCIWGEGILQLMGAGEQFNRFSWVIPDEEIHKASKALSDAKYTRQNRSRSPGESMGDCVYLYPSDHMIEVHLFAKSRLCWTFPDLPREAPQPDDEFYILTSQVQRLEDNVPCVRDYPSKESHPVRMPRPEKFLEALVLLCFRDLILQEFFDPWKKQLRMIAKHLFKGFRCCGLHPVFADYLIRFSIRIGSEDRKNQSLPDPDLHLMYVCLTRLGQLPLPEKDVPRDAWPGEQDIRKRFRKVNKALDVCSYDGPAQGTVMWTHQEVVMTLESEMWK
ncbi:hypothetical protein BO94DRAFT_611392 [Aspergillus sclerotioniger CBS 115572]|uniref:Uncharacterized protein n=1 Tax=Aspergillus sclerotioniger CBS 115572 TaxID=1450535 RepID=A0A317V7U0_9EURO|nr:hypothetical protein BO94DRAFT_611392 [Aspergillus sclerotioniger CBS 115572]PWY69037.1 hypothetical protein BO94DRAFT_611392 [Aspergillus sclerotioniger CBS 115572]